MRKKDTILQLEAHAALALAKFHSSNNDYEAAVAAYARAEELCGQLSKDKLYHCLKSRADMHLANGNGMDALSDYTCAAKLRGESVPHYLVSLCVSYF